jgi:5'-deoxynucleotidase YfbR-like HD superfamily hydrolase
LKEDFKRLISFIIELDKLKSVFRKTRPVGSNRYENSAEHSWQVCVLALILQGYSRMPINIQRVVEMLLVHDIPEIYAGDRLVYLAKDVEQLEAEKESAERIFGLLPPHLAKLCLSRWAEYEARKSDEAVFAYAVDRLMPVLQNIHNSHNAWTENRVCLDDVLRINAAIGEAFPTVWEVVKGLIVDLSRSGVFEHSTSSREQT